LGPLQLVALVGQHCRDLQDDACGRQQSGGSFIDALLVETVALMATEHNHAASVSRVGWAHPQTQTLGRHLDDPAAGATYSDRGLYRIVHDHIISRDHDGASLRR
jgi:hypothetical protein